MSCVLATLSPAAAGAIRDLAVACFLGTLVLLSLIDLRERRLPDRIVLPMLWAGLVLNSSTALLAAPGNAVLGAAAGYATLWLLSATYAASAGRWRPAFGGGDLKLAAMIGAWLGVQALPATLLVAFTSGTCAVLPGVLVGRYRLGQTVPFGPALALGGATALVTGPSLSGWIALGTF